MFGHSWCPVGAYWFHQIIGDSWLPFVVLFYVLAACAKPRSPVITCDMVVLLEPSEGPLEALLEPEITGDSRRLVLFCFMFLLRAQNRNHR